MSAAHALEALPDNEVADDGARRSWALAFEQSADELFKVALSIEGATVTRVEGPVPLDYVGSYLALVGSASAYQVGVLSDIAGCDALSRALLGMTEDDELSAGDRSDAICEIANIVAGGAKRRLERGDDLKLGLPIYVSGRVEPTGPVDLALLKIDFGSNHAIITVFTAGTKRVVTEK